MILTVRPERWSCQEQSGPDPNDKGPPARHESRAGGPSGCVVGDTGLEPVTSTV